MRTFNFLFILSLVLVICFSSLNSMPTVTIPPSGSGGMPTIGSATAPSTPTLTIDQQIEKNLRSLVGNWNNRLAMLNKILNYVGSQTVSSKIQSDFFAQVNQMHNSASSNVTTINIAAVNSIISFLTNYQNSVLFYSGASNAVSWMITYWQDVKILLAQGKRPHGL